MRRGQQLRVMTAPRRRATTPARPRAHRSPRRPAGSTSTCPAPASARLPLGTGPDIDHHVRLGRRARFERPAQRRGAGLPRRAVRLEGDERGRRRPRPARAGPRGSRGRSTPATASPHSTTATSPSSSARPGRGRAPRGGARAGRRRGGGAPGAASYRALDRERRAHDGLGDAERRAEALRESRLARAQVAPEHDHVARREQRCQGRGHRPAPRHRRRANHGHVQPPIASDGAGHDLSRAHQVRAQLRGERTAAAQHVGRVQRRHEVAVAEGVAPTPGAS